MEVEVICMASNTPHAFTTSFGDHSLSMFGLNSWTPGSVSTRQTHCDTPDTTYCIVKTGPARGNCVYWATQAAHILSSICMPLMSHTVATTAS